MLGAIPVFLITPRFFNSEGVLREERRWVKLAAECLRSRVFRGMWIEAECLGRML